jgi:hypothetical protein
MKLERKYMREVEGGTDVECMRILRHEWGMHSQPSRLALPAAGLAPLDAPKIPAFL